MSEFTVFRNTRVHTDIKEFCEVTADTAEEAIEKSKLSGRWDEWKELDSYKESSDNYYAESVTEE